MKEKIFATKDREPPEILSNFIVYNELPDSDKKIFQGKYIHIEELILEINDWIGSRDCSLFDFLDNLDLLAQGILSLNLNKYNISGYLIRSSWSRWVSKKSFFFESLHNSVQNEIFKCSVDLYNENRVINYIERKNNILNLSLNAFYNAKNLDSLFANIIACDVILTDLWSKVVAAKLIER